MCATMRQSVCVSNGDKWFLTAEVRVDAHASPYPLPSGLTDSLINMNEWFCLLPVNKILSLQEPMWSVSYQIV